MNVFDLYASIKLDTSEYDKGLGESSSKTRTAAGKIKSGLQTAGKIGAAAFGAITAAGTATVAGFSAAANSTAEYGDNIDKMSQKMGISAKGYQEWDAVLQHSGTSMDAMKGSFKKLATAAQNGDEAFQKLGISAEDAASMSTEELWNATIAGLQNMEEGTERTAIASDLLGKGATELGALLNTSAEDTQAMKDRVNELGGVMSNDAVKAAAAYEDSLQDLKTGFDGAKRNMTAEFLPAMSEVMDGMTDLMAGNAGAKDKIQKGISDFMQTILDKLPIVIDTAAKLLKAFGGAIADNLPSIIKTGATVLGSLVSGILDHLPDLVQSAADALVSFSDKLANGDMSSGAGGMISKLIEAIKKILPTLATAAVQIVTNLAIFLVKNAPKMIVGAVKLIGQLAAGLIKALPSVIAAVGKIVAAIIGGLLKINWAAKGKEIIAKAVNGISAMVAKVKGVVGKIKTAITNAFDGAKDKVHSVTDKIKSKVISVFTSLHSKVKSIFERMKSAITTPIETAKNKVQSVINRIKSFFAGLRLRIPTPHLPKLPHFFLRTSSKTILGKTITYPTGFGVSWYAKAMRQAYLLNGATIFGASGGNLLGGGEAGSEMVIGTQLLKDMISEGNGDIAEVVERLAESLSVDNLAKAFIKAFAAGGFTIKLDNREVGRMVRKYV